MWVLHKFTPLANSKNSPKKTLSRKGCFLMLSHIADDAIVARRWVHSSWRNPQIEYRCTEVAEFVLHPEFNLNVANPNSFHPSGRVYEYMMRHATVAIAKLAKIEFSHQNEFFEIYMCNAFTLLLVQTCNWNLYMFIMYHSNDILFTVALLWKRTNYYIFHIAWSSQLIAYALQRWN